ncbi:MAG TPA: MBL fold metallo-hydrolase [Verrucomicrobiae bacterium]|nr:MBL fold metallo-hydrolase [Verrucomicrobiae bacterium]
MRKFCLIALLCLPSVVSAQQPQDFSKVEIKVTKVSGSVYMLEGAGGNIAASVGDDGILIVDTEYAPLADKIEAALKGIGITDKPVRFVVDTHYHSDHTDGNIAFGQRGATIIANDNLRKRLENGSTGGNGGALKFQQPPQPKAALPVITYDREMTVHFNGEDIRIIHFPAAHTDGDSVVFFTKSNVVHMGDEFIRYGFPFIDVNGGGTVQGMVAACDRASSEFPADVKVIPGHGAIATLDDVREYTKMMRDTSGAVQAALAAHKTLDQMKQEKILAPWQKYSGTFVNTDAFIETIYYSLTASRSASAARN